MKITIIYDNTSVEKSLQPDWGFSALVETRGKRILFDTGGNGSILLQNMKNLTIAPQEIDEVFISHAHFDHTGGLSAFLQQNSNVKVWVPRSFQSARNAQDIDVIGRSTQLHEGIYSTGELEGIEQSLCIATQKGIVIIVGCSHPKMENIIAAASQFGKVYGIVGGLHGNRPESLQNLNLICATHCTQHKREIQHLYPDAYVEGGAGKVIEIPDT